MCPVRWPCKYDCLGYLTHVYLGQSRASGVESAQNELLESRARYVLRNEVTESVVMANPVLQAVHGGTNASPIER